MRRGALLLLLVTAALSSGTPLSAQTRKTEIKTPAGRFPLEVTAEYLGMAGKKTVVRIRLSSPELSKAAASHGMRSFAGELRGTFSRRVAMVQAFRYRVAGDIKDGKTLGYYFVRPTPAGTYG